MSTNPEHISTFGFSNAPVSRFLLVSSVAATVSVSFLPKSYQSLLNLNLVQVQTKGQVWRLISSMFIMDDSLHLICKSFLIYYFVIIERRMGSAKYVSCILTNWFISLGLYSLVFKSGLLTDYIPGFNIAPMGLHGPLFALLVYYYKAIKMDEAHGVFGLPVSKKSFVYMLAMQLMFADSKSGVLSLFGLLSGVIYYKKFLGIQNWLKVPSIFIKPVNYISSFFQAKTKKPFSRQTFMGATPEIHDDLMFDHLMQRQRRAFSQNSGSGNNSLRTGQGYAEVLNPSFAQLFNNTLPTPQPPQVVPPPPSASVAVEPSEENIKMLIDMGFSRNAVRDALMSTQDNIEQATNILISAAAQT